MPMVFGFENPFAMQGPLPQNQHRQAERGGDAPFDLIPGRRDELVLVKLFPVGAFAHEHRIGVRPVKAEDQRRAARLHELADLVERLRLRANAVQGVLGSFSRAINSLGVFFEPRTSPISCPRLGGCRSLEPHCASIRARTPSRHAPAWTTAW